jgi:hypothetical protein
MRTRRRRYSQSELNDLASRGPHPRQNETVREYLENGWRVYQTETRGGTTIVMMQRGDMFGVMYPNGRFIRPLAPPQHSRFYNRPRRVTCYKHSR